MSCFFHPRLAAALLLALLAANTAHAQDQPTSFSQRLALTLDGNGPWYRVNIPMEVQLGAAHADLRDLRVLDAQGKAQPYALFDTAPKSSSTEHTAPAKLFPLQRPVQAGAPQTDIRIQQNGAVLEVHKLARNTDTSSTPKLYGWLLDASALDFPLERLQLDWSSPQEGFHSFGIEASDDLQHWSNWGQGQIARLAFEGDRLDVSEIQLPAQHAKYLRLLWPASATAAELKSARLLGSTRSMEPAPMVWSAPMVGHQEKAGEFRWQLPQALPLQRVRITIAPELQNVIAPVELSGRNPATNNPQRPVQDWTPLARGVLYRLPQQGGEAQVDALAITHPQAVRELRLRIDSRGTDLGSSAPTLSAGMQSSQIVFLAQGQAPYLLAFGNPKAQAANLPMTVLIPGYHDQQLATLSQATPAAMQAPAAPVAAQQASTSSIRNWKTLGLWLVLGLGVAAIVWMALSLLKSKTHSNT